jgi:hypothetical protein
MTISEIEHLGPHLTRQIYREHIMILTTDNLGRSVLDQWYAATDAWYARAEKSANGVCLALQDFSLSENAATPYARSRAEALVTNHPTVRGRSAIVIAPRLYIQMLTQNLITHLEGAMERRTFQDRETALSWLEELL